MGFSKINSKLALDCSDSHSSEESNKSYKSRLHVTFKECKDLARSVHDLSKSFVDNYISDVSCYGGKQFGQFLPADLHANQLGAKASSDSMLPTNVVKTVRSKICHGCHEELGNSLKLNWTDFIGRWDRYQRWSRITTVIIHPSVQTTSLYDYYCLHICPSTFSVILSLNIFT